MKYRFYQSPIHGIGCIANQDIEEGEIINEEPFFKFQRGTTHPVLNDYFWSYEGEKYIINGLGNYANHSYENNCKPNFSKQIFTTRLVPFVAVKKINKNEEILNNYGETYWNNRSMSKTELSKQSKNEGKTTTPNYINISRNNMFNLFPSKNTKY